MNLGNQVDTKRQGAIQAQLNRLDEMIESLKGCTSNLYDCIEAILRPEKQAEPPQDIPPHSSGTPLAMRLEAKNMELREIMASINSIIDRVEL